jgi:hypothetical protein
LLLQYLVEEDSVTRAFNLAWPCGTITPRSRAVLMGLIAVILPIQWGLSGMRSTGILIGQGDFCGIGEASQCPQSREFEAKKKT